MVTSILDWPEGRATQPLSELDWRVVDTARADGPRSLNPDGLVSRLIRAVFGISGPRALANEKLEALRRFSVRAWYWDFIRAKDVRTFFDAGYSRTNVLEILSRIGMTRGFTPSIQDEFERISPRKRSVACRCG
jgi:hypothetical protein